MTLLVTGSCRYREHQWFTFSQLQCAVWRVRYVMKHINIIIKISLGCMMIFKHSLLLQMTHEDDVMLASSSKISSKIVMLFNGVMTNRKDQSFPFDFFQDSPFPYYYSLIAAKPALGLRLDLLYCQQASSLDKMYCTSSVSTFLMSWNICVVLEAGSFC